MFDFSRPRVMGILNVTPDSFSDGGCFVDVDKAVAQALAMQEEGAEMIDVGGESTRPGAAAITVDEELSRVIPVIEQLSEQLSVPISIDSSKPMVMRKAVNAGASMVNDVRALRQEDALATVAELGVPVCLMHMQGEPGIMQASPDYPIGVVAEVKQFLEDRIEKAVAAGISRKNILIDPGFGFGKTLQQNYLLLKELPRLSELGMPILVGLSRKSMIGNLLDVDVDERLPGSLAGAVIAAIHGASIIRVHDVKETVQVLAVVKACYASQDS